MLNTSSKAPNRDFLNETMDAAATPDEPPSDGSASLAPIYRIPFDIFQIIIKMCQDEPSRSFRFTVSHACRLWREHALAMPLLWNSLHINKRVPCWEMLEAMLKRSSQAPLDIYIGQAPFVKSALPHLRKIMRMILPHLERLRKLHLQNAPYKVRRILLDQIRAKRAPRLEEVKVSQSAPYERPSRLRLKNSSPNWRPESVFIGFPNLNSIEWTHSTGDINALPTFKNLINLTLGDGTLEDIPPRPFIQLIHHVLLDSPSLETLKVYNYPTYTWQENFETEAMNLQLPVLTHHSLQTLFIETTDRVRSAAIRSLILPKLRTFSTAYDVDSIDLSCCDIIAQENSLPDLRVVSISGDVDDDAATSPFHAHLPFLRPAIQNLANLRVLTFRAINFDHGRWLPDLGNCCPNLRWLLFLFCTGYTIPSIRLLVETRVHTDGVNPLEILCIQPWSDAPPECWVDEEDAVWFSKLLKFKDEDDCWHTEPEAR
ncbi:hypothetical protein FRC01_012809 [Tulasnella sp. 417]|nr:hypothetical protein FRC01_012809 [Tulasnella sp. 417]